MEYIIDCNRIDSRSALHRALAETLSFPDWYGHNLDALHDMLTAITEDTHLILRSWDALPPAFRGFQAVLDDAEEENPYLIVTYQ